MQPTRARNNYGLRIVIYLQPKSSLTNQYTLRDSAETIANSASKASVPINIFRANIENEVDQSTLTPNNSNSPIGTITTKKKANRHKMSTHKRKKRLRKNRHKHK